MSSRFVLPLSMLVGALLMVGWVVRQGQLPPADFTFCNETEIKSLDPAIVVGQPEGRIAWAIYECLVRLNPRDQTPIPGVATHWEVSDDKRTYTFHLRKDARWSNGDPVTAHDFTYSIRRLLDPFTAAEYSYQAWYLENAERYTKPALGIKPGERVEVERHSPLAGALPFARGEILRGELLRVEIDQDAGEKGDDPEHYATTRTFVVKIDDAERRFRITRSASDSAPDNAEGCKQVLLDFDEVGIRAVDDHTVEMRLKAPTPYWLELVGFWPLSPVHRPTVEAHGSPAWTYPENLVSNGPYRVKFRRLRDRIRLVKNEHYWGRDSVALETIDALAVESLNTAFNLYETGEVDWITKAPPLIFRELLKADPPRPDVNPQPMLTSYYYLVNVHRPPLDDVRVRTALAMALDRREIVETACAGEQPARSLTPPGMRGYAAPECRPSNPDEARRLLAEAGYPDGRGFRKLEILYNNNEVHQTIAELVRKQWQRVLGINVATRNEEWSTYNNSLRFQEFDIARRAWGGDYLDPNTFLDMFLTGGENNDPKWSNAEYDGLIEAAKQEADVDRRLGMLRRAETILMRELPILPIYHYVSPNLVRPRVRGFYNNLRDDHPLWALSIDDNATGPNEFRAPQPTPDEIASENPEEGAE